MDRTMVRLYSLRYNDMKTYLVATILVVGNLLFPQLCHLIPGGGITWLPIYFFTLVGAYKYGIRVGLLSAILSPLANYLIFGMPPIGILPIIIIKSSILAIITGLLAAKFNKISIVAIILAVVSYQIIGTGIEYLITSSENLAIQDFVIGFPGMLFQILGGYFVLITLHKL